MKINKLKLNNFSSFEGINVLDLSPVGRKNIILIGGKNGAGKTSLFSAIKIALYGPLAFGYLGANSFYSAKIKEYINAKAFQKEDVIAGVEVEIELVVDREITKYCISREWTYSEQKLCEKCIIKQNGELLNEDEESYFHNYLMNVIPPTLFDFFLFDGEEVGTVFSTKNYNSYVKNALFTMCGMDVYEILRKYAANYIAKNSITGTSSEENIEAMFLSEDRLEKETNNLTELVEQLASEREKIEIELEELESAFRNAGGITEADRKKLDEEYTVCEQIKQDCSAQIKQFVEGIMPFYIVREFVPTISEQFEREERAAAYKYLKGKIGNIDMAATIKKYFDGDTNVAETIKEELMTILFPEDACENRMAIHDFSKEDTRRVLAMLSLVDSVDSTALIRTIKNKYKAVKRAANINKKIKGAMSVDERKIFSEKENAILRRKEEISELLHSNSALLEKKQNELVTLNLAIEKKRQQLAEDLQNRHVYELSDGISKMMKRLLDKKAMSLKKELEAQIVDNLRKIYRKNNLVTHLEINDTFQFNLFQDAAYTVKQLKLLVNNLGIEEFQDLIGKAGLIELYENYQVTNIEGLLTELSSLDDNAIIESYKKIELSRLSKGERQIFILALYWAIIQISGQNIPFVIDTPYARIDANHRREISEKFFPSISKQVVILSTDEEINEEYYEILKPFIAREYLLTNDEKENRTTIDNKYFFEVPQ